MNEKTTAFNANNARETKYENGDNVVAICTAYDIPHKINKVNIRIMDESGNTLMDVYMRKALCRVNVISDRIEWNSKARKACKQIVELNDKSAYDFSCYVSFTSMERFLKCTLPEYFENDDDESDE